MKLSVLVPVFNEAATLADALKRVLDVEYPCELEVVIVNDGSRDDTLAILDALRQARDVVHGDTQTRSLTTATLAAVEPGSEGVVRAKY